MSQWRWSAPGRIRSEPTYEGLKHDLCTSAHRGDCGSEPTYEGLKQAPGARGDGQISRSEPTYEGLKHPEADPETKAAYKFRAYL